MATFWHTLCTNPNIDAHPQRSTLKTSVEKSQVDVVPKIHMGGGAQGGGSLIESLLGLLLSEKAGQLAGVTTGTPPNPEAEAMKAVMRQNLMK